MSDRVILTEGGVALRPLRPEDAVPIYDAVRESINELTLRTPWCHPGYALSESQQWIEFCRQARQEEKEYHFVITDGSDDALLGCCGLNQLHRENRLANLGYWVRTGRTRRGIATAAATALARYAFTELGFNRIEIMAVGNLASQGVARKVGALREGVLRQRLVLHGEVHDVVLFSLLREDLHSGSVKFQAGA